MNATNKSHTPLICCKPCVFIRYSRSWSKSFINTSVYIQLFHEQCNPIKFQNTRFLTIDLCFQWFKSQFCRRMPKRKLSAEASEALHRALQVRGASERAVQEIWNICRSKHERLGRGSFLLQMEHELGPWKAITTPVEFECLDGSKVELPLLSLPEALRTFCDSAPPFVEAITKALASTSDTCLTPIIYCDEATAGNVLSVDKARKACLWYMSWLELWHYLKSSHVWIPVAVVQTRCIQQIQGGTSAITVQIMKQLLTEESFKGYRLGEALFFKQRPTAWFLGDFEAVRAVFSLKGSAGLRPCVLCKNVVKSGCGVSCHDDYFKEISASHGFEPSSDAEIFSVCDRLVLCTTKKAQERLEITSGISFSTKSLMWSDQRLRMPPSQILYDWMHTYLSNGCASWEVCLFLQTVEAKTNVTRELLQEAVCDAQWQGTRTSGKTPNYVKNLFAERMFGEGLYKGQAHQTSAVVPLIRWLLEEKLATHLPEDVVMSFRFLSDIVSFVRELQHELSAVDARSMQHLGKLQRQHHTYFGRAYGVEAFKPKHHHRFHLMRQWEKVGFITSTEPLESKHGLYKSGMADRQRGLVNEPGAYSASILVRLLRATSTELQKHGLPFWQLLAPIQDASLDDKVFFCSMDLRTSKSPWVSYIVGAVRVDIMLLHILVYKLYIQLL